MIENDWKEAMKQMESIRLFSSLYVRKSKKGAVASAQEVDAMFRIALTEVPMTPHLLSQSMGVSKTIVSRLIENLTSKAYVEKRYNMEDKRSYHLCITEEGRKQLDLLCHYYLDPLYELEKKLGEEPFAELIRLIQAANHQSQEEFI